MFEIPNAKRIRRSELQFEDELPSSSPDLDASEIARAKLASHFSNVYAEPTPQEHESQQALERSQQHTAQAGATANDDDEGVFAFRLFSNPVKSVTASKDLPEPPQEPIRICIRSPSPERQGPGLVNPGRPNSYYFAKPWSDEHRLASQPIICTSDSIETEAKRSWPGCALPWRVKSIRLTRKQARALMEGSLPVEGISVDEQRRGRSRAGKKRRIVVRKRVKAKVERAEMAKREAAEKEAADRERRTRKNREKKVRKKEKERVKKNSEQAAAGEAAA